MPGATIVYNGGGGGGDLFDGLKFYMLQRVPLRDRWKDLVVSNGGEVVLAEAHSNIIIADHAQTKQPIGSISWTFIDQSVKNGRLEDQEDHRADAATREVREVGSAQPARQGRIPFSVEDDTMLMEWCTRAERQGASVKGNVLFQQLEKKNPRHTYQSWRDRWVKKLINMPRPDLNDDEVEEEEEGEEAPVVLPRPIQRKQVPHDIPTPRDMPTRSKKAPSSIVAASTRPVKKEPVRAVSESNAPVQRDTDRGVHKTQRSNVQDEVPRQSSRKPSTPVRSSPLPKSTPSTIEPKGNVFSEEETEKVVELYDGILTVRDDQTIDFWNLWSKENPEHTAQEWYNHFKEYVVPMMKLQIEKGKSKEKPSPAPVKVVPKASMASPKPISQPVPQRITEVKDSQDQYATQSPNKISSQTFIIPYASDEEAFRDDIKELADRLKVDVEFDFAVGDRSISMFRLWEVVMAEAFGGFKNVNDSNLWPEVAHQLGFDIQQQPGTLTELQAYFQEYEGLLLEFEDLAREEDEEIEEVLDRNDSSLLADQLLEMIEHNINPIDADEDTNVGGQEVESKDDTNSPQMSPHQKQISSNSRKRLSGGSSPYTKRQRVDKGKGKELEIPSTPEDIITSPQTLRRTLEPSPLKNASFPAANGSDEEYSEEEDELFVSPTNSDRTKQPRNPEPETQDFHFPNATQKTDRLSSPNISSSPPVRLKQIHQSQTSNAATRGSAHSINVEDSSTQSQTQSQMNAILDQFIADMVAKGFTYDIVLEALQATTLKCNANVEEVAESLSNDEHIPDNIRGVWTQWDDEELGYSKESKQYRHVLLKHGPEEIRERIRFLRDLADSED